MEWGANSIEWSCKERERDGGMKAQEERMEVIEKAEEGGKGKAGRRNDGGDAKG